MEQFRKTVGLIAAPYTPMDEKGDVVFGKIPEYYDFLEKNGIKGAFVNGSTGEGVSLSAKEKMTITETWMKCARESRSVRIINLVGGTSYAECIDQALHSSDQSVDAIAILAPYYFKPASAKQLAEFCARIAESVPELPVYYYHIPVLTGCYIPMYDFLQEASAMIPNLAGIKCTHEDFMDFLRCLNFRSGEYDMLWGRDENLLPALAVGARGAVGSTYNFAAPLYHQLIGSFDKGDWVRARELQLVSVNMISLMGKYGGMGAGKAFMKYIGFDCGEFRLPVNNLNKHDYERFRIEIRELRMENLFSVI